jgi:hypothetical protein
LRWRRYSQGALLSPFALPAGATHRSDGRGVDVDAGQGDCYGGVTIARLGAYLTLVNIR